MPSSCSGKMGVFNGEDYIVFGTKVRFIQGGSLQRGYFLFYAHSEKQGKFVIRVCGSLPCYLKGSREILEAIKKELNIEEYQTTPDKKFTIEPVSCLGLCDIAPAIVINKEVYGNLTPQKVRDIIQKYKEAK